MAPHLAAGLAISVRIEKRLVRSCKKFTVQKSDFKARVLSLVKKIPKGKTLSYGEVARRAGNSGAARAVGAILHTNYDPTIPCHRVIRADGTLGGYNRGSLLKKRRLLSEAEFNTKH